MTRFESALSNLALSAFLVLGVMPAASSAGDLSRYRNFGFGTDVSTVAKEAGASPAQARVVTSRPALIQELEWHPQPLGSSTHTEAVQQVVFSFYNGELYRIVVNYDHYETEGLTANDIVQAVSAIYGTAEPPPASAKATHGPYGDQEEHLATWQDPQYRFDLIRSSYGPTFRLTGVLKRLEAPAQAATLEAKRLDDQEAPQRDAARLASEDAAATAKLEKARLANKSNFRP